MADREKVIKGLEKAKIVIEEWIPMFEQYNTPAIIDDAIELLEEQEAEEQREKHPCESCQEFVCDGCPCADA